MTSGAEHPAVPRNRRGRRESADDQVRRKALRPLASLDELEENVWGSDDELAEFLSFVGASRHADHV